MRSIALAIPCYCKSLLTWAFLTSSCPGLAHSYASIDRESSWALHCLSGPPSRWGFLREQCRTRSASYCTSTTCVLSAVVSTTWTIPGFGNLVPRTFSNGPLTRRVSGTGASLMSVMKINPDKTKTMGNAFTCTTGSVATVTWRWVQCFQWIFMNFFINCAPSTILPFYVVRRMELIETLIKLW